MIILYIIDTVERSKLEHPLFALRLGRLNQTFSYTVQNYKARL